MASLSSGPEYEKYKEARFFLNKMAESEGEEFNYYFSAFLSSSRSVTFHLQKEYSGSDEFDSYYGNIRDILSEEPVAAVMKELRNYTEKEGVVDVVGQEETLPGVEVYDPRELPYDRGNLPDYSEPTKVYHVLEMPDTVATDVPDDLMEQFEENYEQNYIEIYCNAYLGLLFFILERNPEIH